MSRTISSLTLSQNEIMRLLELFPQGIVALDLETTGLSPLVDKVIEIAAVKILPDQSLTIFHQLINPLIDVPASSTIFHGLTNEDLKSAMTLKKPLRSFWDFCERLPLIAHNSTFDLGYLIKASHDYQMDFPPLDIYDSCRYARALYKKHPQPPENFKLSTLCDFMEVELHHHIALEDTMACLKIMAFLAGISGDHKLAREKSFIFRLSQFTKNECFNFSTRLKNLVQLVQTNNLLEIEYKNSTHSGLKRPLRPIGLLPLPQGAVLFAECLLTGMNKSFALKKIKSYHPLEACLWKN